MQTEKYRGYTLLGHAIVDQADMSRPTRFAGSATVTRGAKVVDVSGVLGTFGTGEEAESAGIAWCRAWVKAMSNQTM